MKISLAAAAGRSAPDAMAARMAASRSASTGIGQFDVQHAPA
jgi:hypothetical protein